MYTVYCIKYDTHSLEVFGHYECLKDANDKLEQVALEFMADEEGRKRAVIYNDIPSDEEVPEGYFLCRYDVRQEETMPVPNFGESFKTDVYLRRRNLTSRWVGTSVEITTVKVKFYSIAELKDTDSAQNTTVPAWGKKKYCNVLEKKMGSEFANNYQSVIDEFKKKLAERAHESDEEVEIGSHGEFDDDVESISSNASDSEGDSEYTEDDSDDESKEKEE